MEQSGAHVSGDVPRPHRARLARLYRRHHRVVWVVFALNTAFLLAFTLLASPFHGPDEPAHFDMIHQYERHPGLREPNRRIRFVIIGGPVARRKTVLSPAPYGVKSPMLSVQEAAPRSHRPTLAQLVPKAAEFDQMTQHPPLYYLVMAGVMSAITHPDHFW